MNNTTGLLLINLGTPERPDISSVRRYLREFLSDKRVIDIPVIIRYLILYLFILPFRPSKSAHAYQSIWTPEGSPLLVYHLSLAEKVQKILNDRQQPILVIPAMRYGNPSIASALKTFHSMGISNIQVLPLFPQYAAASWGSAVAAVFEEATKVWDVPAVSIIPPFYNNQSYLDLLAESGRPFLERSEFNHILFTFHGIPVRQLLKSDQTGTCTGGECCSKPVNQQCYRSQCVQTASEIASRLNLAPGSWSVSFQSRLGPTRWIEPYTETTLLQLASTGVKRLLVFSPAFVADCLETLEELGIRGREAFIQAGGEDYQLVPALNDGDDWAALIARMAETPSGQADQKINP